METKRSKTYFVADIHLGASYIADPSAHERRFVSFLESIAGDAARVYLLGDILDYHFEYKNAIPARCLRTIGLLGRLADRGIDIVWIAGNHDTWFRGTLARELGITTPTATLRCGSWTISMEGSATITIKALDCSPLFMSKPT
ncbi:MAG: metallophosphoesterase [Acetatifactor sp.]|nr:metallophosphoesterase [Acetatifactor sp.]